MCVLFSVDGLGHRIVCSKSCEVTSSKGYGIGCDNKISLQPGQCHLQSTPWADHHLPPWSPLPCKYGDSPPPPADPEELAGLSLAAPWLVGVDLPPSSDLPGPGAPR
mmetsp:Transcript_46534/g.140984  ORF Transcript_46534/g.140984 Transcript_46534/m.140984 type:complete len:107 (+) Transcript_46534:132-452(+)